MNARDKLRSYLEQRRDIGESELVLDSMELTEVLRIIGALPGDHPRTMAADAQLRGDAAIAPGARSVAADGRQSESSMPSDQGPTDWRTALLAADASREPDAGEQQAATVGIDASGKSDAPANAPMPDEISGLASLEEVAQMVNACRRCSLYATATHGVPGEGNPEADFVCVGEAPGANEDATGRPFVGQAGQLLTKILAAINLKREDVFICNVLKHRPPGNRNPQPGEVAACSPYLRRQLELIKPKVIVAFGTFAAQTLLDTKLPLGKLRGQIHEYHGVPLIVTYHPAALLRNPSWKRPTWEDVQLARRILDSTPPPGRPASA